jgi:phage terminase large subunit GpA-like protein
MTKRIPTVWLQDLKTEEERTKAEKTIKAFVHSDLGRRLLKIIETKATTAVDAQVKVSAYDKAAWPYYQAHLNGVREAWREMSDLFKFTEE